MLSWYESGLPPRERKVRGHFSTPPQLVEQILDACGYTPDRDLSATRVLDPACGSGNFLSSVVQRLVAFARNNELDRKQLVEIVRCNVWGFDSDPVSCFLAEMQVRAALSEKNSVNDEKHRAGKQLFPLHIHQADALTFPWERSNVDLFLANPPYLAAKNTDLSGYRSAQQRGQVDSYLLFLDLALQIVRPGGWLALVLPDPMLARANAAGERRRLLRETTIHHLWHLSDVFAAHVGAVVLIAQKHPPSRLHQIIWERGSWQRRCQNSRSMKVGTIDQSLLRHQPGAELRYLLGTGEHTLVERLHRRLCVRGDEPGSFAILGEFVSIRRGEELSKSRVLSDETYPAGTDGQTWYPVLRGGVDIHPYRTPRGNGWIARQDINKPLERYLAPKLLIVKSTGRLQAALDLQGHVVLQTLYMLTLCEERPGKQEDELYFLLALLNSQLVRDYVYVLHTAYKWVQPQLEQHVLTHLPIPTIQTPERACIIRRARLLMHACSQATAVVELDTLELYQQQEQAICELYEAALRADRFPCSFEQLVDKGVKRYG